jgi:hypothetical protein
MRYQDLEGERAFNRAAQPTTKWLCSEHSPVEAEESHFPYSRSRLGGYIKGARALRAEMGSVFPRRTMRQSEEGASDPLG